jgi:formate dehydrogenase subunit gamma
MTRSSTPVVPSSPVGGQAAEEWVSRFGLTERFAHWWTVSMVVVAVFSGLGLGDDTRSGPVFITHIGAVIAIGVGLLAAAAAGDHRALLRAARRLFTFDRRDVDWMRSRVRHPLGTGDDGHDWGMFNTGQKVLAWAVTGSLAAVVVTGIQAAGSGGEGGLHGAAVVVLMVLLGAHVFMAVVNPATRPALAGMVFGRVRRSWAATHHAAWLRHVDQSAH